MKFCLPASADIVLIELAGVFPESTIGSSRGLKSRETRGAGTQAKCYLGILFIDAIASATLIP